MVVIYSSKFKSNRHGILQSESNKRFRNYTLHYTGGSRYDYKIQKHLIEELNVDLSKYSNHIINVFEFVLAIKVPLDSKEISEQNHKETPWLNSNYNGKEVTISEKDVYEYFKKEFSNQSIEYIAYSIIFNNVLISKTKNEIRLLSYSKLISLMEFMDKTWLGFWNKSNCQSWINQTKTDSVLSDLFFPNDLIEIGDDFNMSYQKENIPELLIFCAKKGNFLALVHVYNMIKFLDETIDYFYEICLEYFEKTKNNLKISYQSLTNIGIILDIEIVDLDKNDPQYLLSTYTPTSLLRKSYMDCQNAHQYYKKGYEMKIPYFYFAYGQYLKNTNQINESKKVLNESIKKFPTFGLPFLELYYLYSEEGDHEKSIETLEKALNIGHLWSASFLFEIYRINQNIKEKEEKEEKILSQGSFFVAPSEYDKKYEDLIEKKNDFLKYSKETFEIFRMKFLEKK